MLGISPLLAGIPGGYELWIILLVLLLLFGSRIPKVARSLGQGISQFKKGLNDASEGLSAGDEEDAPAPAKKAPAKPEEPPAP